MPATLFTTLSRCNLSSAENYLTESLAYVLRLLIERQPEQGREILRRLSGLADCAMEGSLTIRTQVTTEAGIPDMEIRGANGLLVYVEVKHGAPLGVGQLEAYRHQLDTSGACPTALVLLTRSLASAFGTTLSPERFHHVCWYEIHDWLAEAPWDDEPSAFIAGEFRSYLEEQRMSQHSVDWDYIRGVPAMLHLSDMLEAAIQEAVPGEALKRTGGWSWRGYRIPPSLWCGVRYHAPLIIVFEDNNGYHPVTYHRELDLQDTHFFALNKNQQFERLIRFVAEAWSGAPREESLSECPEQEEDPAVAEQEL